MNDDMTPHTGPAELDALGTFVHATQIAELLALLAGTMELATELGVSVDPALPAELERQSAAKDLPAMAHAAAAELGADASDVLAIGEISAQLARAIAGGDAAKVEIQRAELDRALAGLRAELGR